MEKINFTFIVHSGQLEVQGLLLASSIREHYDVNEANIYIGVPRHLGGVDNGMSKSIRKQLKNLGCCFFEVVNPIGEDYLIGNKLNCFPPKLSGVKIFLDTDTLLLKKLTQVELSPNSVALKPADKKTYKWSDEDWKIAYLRYTDYELSDQDYIYSTTFLEPMRPYYNAGVIISHSPIFEKEWGNLSLTLDKDSSFDVKRPWLDQLALPLVLKKHNIQVIQLDENYNYPGHLKDLPENLPQIVHYHQPNTIAQDRRLLEFVINLTNKHPVLLSYFEAGGKKWRDLKLTIDKFKENNQYFYINKSVSKQNHFITGLPRSGTSYLCSLLDKDRNNLIINEPKEVIFPLNKQPIPYGIKSYYKKIRQDIYLNKAILNKHIQGQLIQDTLNRDVRTKYRKQGLTNRFNIFTKNTIVYLLGVERIKSLMPNSQIIALFRNPVDTIASWSTGFKHLQEAKPFDIKTFRLQQHFLPMDEVEILTQINDTECIWTRRCMLWNYFAQKLLKNSHQVNLISYEMLVRNPQIVMNYIKATTNQETNQIYLPSTELKSKRNQLNDDSIEKIKLLTNSHYDRLCNLNCIKT